MSGILEQLLDALNANTAAVRAITGVNAASLSLPNTATQLQQPATVEQPPATVTADQLTGLVLPHIGNPAVKEALGVAMRALGIAGLPEAQPHQYGPLFVAFQKVLAGFGIGAPDLTPKTSSSII